MQPRQNKIFIQINKENISEILTSRAGLFDLLSRQIGKWKVEEAGNGMDKKDEY